MSEPAERKSSERPGASRGLRKSSKAAPQSGPHVVLVAGKDEFSVRRRARQLFDEWRKATGDLDNEIIDADVRSAADALKAIAHLREAVQTLPFFGAVKVVWMRDCSFLSPEKSSRAKTPSPLEQSLADLAQFLRSFEWTNVRLLISGGPVTQEAPIARAIAEIGKLEVFDGLSAADRDWADRAEDFVRAELKTRNQQIDDDALGALVAAVGPNLRQLANETEKVSLYAGIRSRITIEDVDAVVSQQKQAQAFGLAEALGDRNLPAALQHLEDELWQTRMQSDYSLLSVLHSLVAKLRAMLLVKELQRVGYLSPTNNYKHFKTRLDRIPTGLFPEDPKCNPLKVHPYTLFKASLQTSNYAVDELVNGIQVLLDCNRKLVGSQLDEAAVLQGALVRIIGTEKRNAGRRSAR